MEVSPFTFFCTYIVKNKYFTKFEKYYFGKQVLKNCIYIINIAIMHKKRL